MPSLEDNLPQTGVEAMACGTPVVAFDTGGVPDYVKPMQTGLLAEVGNDVDLAEKIGWLADHRDERHRMSENARALISGVISQASIGNQTLPIDDRFVTRSRWLMNVLATTKLDPATEPALAQVIGRFLGLVKFESAFQNPLPPPTSLFVIGVLTHVEKQIVVALATHSRIWIRHR